MNKLVFAIDFDCTLTFTNEFPEIGTARTEAFETVKALKKAGHKIILWTCRTDKHLKEAISFCKKQGLIFDAVNCNLPENIEKYGGDSRKIHCDYYIDDKNFGTHVLNWNLIKHTFNL
jgi:hydroxymethylpyrimidine pyrophosphatase-like HAD family hydrolase